MRIFISYKHGDATTDAFFGALKAALEAAGLEVVSDHRLGGGDAWRAKLNEWLLGCHGAVLLLSPAALGSPWVRHEVSVLMARHLVAPREFVVVPVRLGASLDDLGAPALEPANLPEVQSVDAADGAAPVVAALGARLGSPPPTALEAARRRVVQCLNSVTAPTAAAILADLHLAAGGVDAVAAALVDDPLRLATVIPALRTAGLSEAQLRRLFDLVDPGAWIPEAVAAAVAGVLFGTGPERAVVLSAGDLDLMPPAVRARSFLFPEETDRVRITGEVFTEDPAAELNARAKAEVIARKGHPKVPPEKTWASVERRPPGRGRIAVDVPLDHPDPGLLRGLGGGPLAWFVVRADLPDPDPCGVWAPDPTLGPDAELEARLRRQDLVPE